MVLHVHHIIVDVKGQGHFFIRGPYNPSPYQVFRRYLFDNVEEMAIILLPEINEPHRFNSIIVGESYPVVLVIGDIWFILELNPYKTLMIIRRTVNEVAKDFLFAPFFGSRFMAEFSIWYLFY